MIRIPGLLVGLLSALILNVVLFLLAARGGGAYVLTLGLPLSALMGGYLAGRWAIRPAIVPGLSVGMLIVATQLGMGFGTMLSLFAYVSLLTALLELIGAICGGMIGTLIARRTAGEPMPEPAFRLL